MKQTPVIIIGMHRSGTTLLTRLLHQLGLFTGARTGTGTHEARFFLYLNTWMFRQCNAHWDNPYNFRWADNYMYHHFQRVIRERLNSMKLFNYLGARNFVQYQRIQHVPFPWGWKDPRNTFTAPVWKTVFPGARLIHIYRHPVDVARSLQKREQQLRQSYRRTFKEAVKEYFLWKKPKWSSAPRVIHLQEGIYLWEQYVKQARSLSEQWPDHYLSIRYESLLDTPAPQLRTACQFIGLSPSRQTIEAVTETIRGDRKYAFRQDAKLRDLSEEIKTRETVQQMGYDRL